jgi:hypothetical protein
MGRPLSDVEVENYGDGLADLGQYILFGTSRQSRGTGQPPATKATTT